ncbi:pilus assembly PilX family protein [Collimonas sp.]|jgi:type IV pilus assembly protein PilX|uniref:pilus assembly PilX family protein n=1 Tax=Collimonas sp. TaxID=1963772 RepID=UPI002B7FFB6B|nr:PilX N-terminal domain-containing pilus assembly protein [Collimonas sp.]HWX00346.1 PilX N-terminal domain-containing pilus assembly protein [Collimonas sp.]
MTRLRHCRQRGAVLPMLLISLLVMAFLGASALRTALQEEKMAANADSRQLAFQAAEHALRFCEHQLQLTPVTIPQLRQGPPAADGRQYWEMADSWRNDEVSVAVARIGTEGVAPAAPARCLVERLQLEADLQFRQYVLPAPLTRPAFRITARGVGASNAAVVLLQSYLLL